MAAGRSSALGDLVADQVQDVVLRLTFPFGQLGRETGIIVGISDREGVFAAAGVRDARAVVDLGRGRGERWPAARRRTSIAPWRASSPRGPARTAVLRNRVGDYAAARHALEATAKRIKGYAARDAVLREVADSLESESLQAAAPMSARLAKEMYSDSYYEARQRDPMGRSRKSR